MGKFDLSRMLADLNAEEDAAGDGASSAPARPAAPRTPPPPLSAVRPVGADAGTDETPDASSGPTPTPAGIEAAAAVGGEGEGDAVVHDTSEVDGFAPLDERGASVDASRDVAGAGVAAIYDPEADAGPSGASALRDRLLAEGVVTEQELTAAETVAKQSPDARLLGLLLESATDEDKLMRVAAETMGLAFERVVVDGDPDDSFDSVRVQRLGVDFCKKHEVLPLRTEGQRLVLATARPDDVFCLDDVRTRLRARSIKAVVATPTDVRTALDLLDDGSASEVDVDEILDDIEEDDVRVEEDAGDEVDLEREAAESPVIRYVNYIIQTAVKEGASDIHIEPGEKSLKVRLRIDGILFESMQPPARMSAAITSRLKIMANLDISERRVPQDGRIRCTVAGRKLDLRMSTLPTPAGEKTVLRILDQKSINVSLDDLGFDAESLEVWKSQIEQPHGIVLVTGPTGSGKTTTLYASLRQMDKKSRNISTVEDPIEYHLDGITQTQTHERIGMTFAAALKSLLRQDPDIIMVGEIRDMETAHTAVQAALTGHLVLSTLHTNDAPSSITRLVNIGIEPFLLGAAVNAALAQRLVRRICENCRRQARLTDDHREFLEIQGIDPESVFEGAGCAKCRGTGHSGRLGIYELLVVDDQVRDVVARNPNVTEFRRQCCERGMVTLRQDGLAKVKAGRTTVQEILRVTESTI